MVSCGAVHYGNCVEVQWCYHGDELRRSVLEVGVTECESAYPNSTLIFTARAMRQHLTPSQFPHFHSIEVWVDACSFEKMRESGSGILSTGREGCHMSGLSRELLLCMSTWAVIRLT